ncbi:MAG: 50S ribosomal protein L29 [bacterium]|nr:50S ribosomal protein L29 [bacterium]
MKIKELINKNKVDLAKMLTEKQEALRTFRFGVAGSKVRNVREGRGIRRQIAQILSLLNQK